MSTIPRMRPRPDPIKSDHAVPDPVAPDPAAPPGVAQPRKRAPLSKRLTQMTDAELLSIQRAAVRVSDDEGNPRQSAARRALPMIDAEIGKRAAAPQGASLRPAGAQSDE